MCEHNHISLSEFEKLEAAHFPGLTEQQDDFIINHLRFSGQHPDSFQNNSRFSDPNWFNQLRSHSAAVLRGEIKAENLK